MGAQTADELTEWVIIENQHTPVVVHGVWHDGQWRVFNFGLDWQDCERC